MNVYTLTGKKKTLTCVHFPYTVVLHTVTVSHGEGIVTRLTLALSDQEGASQVASLEEFLLCIRSLDLTKVPPDVWEEGGGGGGGRKGEEEEGGRGRRRREEGRGGRKGEEGGRREEGEGGKEEGGSVPIKTRDFQRSAYKLS